MNILEKIKDNVDIDLVMLTGFDNAVIGIDCNSMRLIYSVKKIIQILIEEGMEEIDARDYFYYNIGGSWIGDSTPIYCNDDYE